MLKTLKFTPENYSDWDEFVLITRRENVFSLSGWVKPLSGLNNSEVCIIGISEGGSIIAGLAGVISGTYGIRIFEPPLLSPYNGIIIDPSVTESKDQIEAYKLLLDNIKPLCDRLIIQFYPGISPVETKPAYGLKSTERFTSFVDLSANGSLRSGFKADIKNKINKAERSGISVVEDFNPAELHRLLELVYNKAGLKSRWNEDPFYSALKAIQQEGWLQIWFSVKDDRYVAGTAIVIRDDTAYSWLSATDPEYYKLGAGPKLISDTLQQLSNQAVKHFDFMGVNIPSVGRYKEAFGGERVTFASQDYVFSIKGRLYRALQDRLKR
ncbi:MAG: GNAT family N-acetyltransferase [candidate division Zixibacteria bacterium]|nr:GNAT family N-acetyltransferase [candidate division Zixibacteria bacterium]